MATASIVPAWGGTTSVPSLPDAGNLPRPLPTEVVYVKDEPGEAIFRNPAGTFALQLPTKYRVSVQDVANVFTGSDVKPVAGQEITGLSILLQLTEVWREGTQTDTELALPLCPVSAHLVLKLPNSSLVTTTTVAALLSRLLGGIIREDDATFETALAPVLFGATRLAEPDPEAV